MDQRNIEKIDIEKCKELFEYEMTEVVLMLKGEFASVSGKNLGYSQHHVSEEKRNAPLALLSQVHIPSFQIQPLVIPKELTAKVIAQRARNSKPISTDEQADNCTISVSKPDVALPKMQPTTGAYAIPALQMKPVSTFAVPKAFAVQMKEIPTKACDLPKVQLPTIANVLNADIPAVSVVRSNTDIPAIQHFNVNTPVVESTAIRVDIPNVKKHADLINASGHDQQSGSLTMQKIQLDNTAVPAVPPVSIPPITGCDSNINIPKITKIPMPSLSKIPAANGLKVTLPVKIASECKTDNGLHSTRISELDLVQKIDAITYACVPQKRDAIVSPLPEMCFVSEQKVLVPSIPKCSFVQQAKPMCLRKLSDITIPSKPRMQQEIDEILLAAFN